MSRRVVDRELAVPFPYWTIPAAITLWLSVWVYLGYRFGDSTVMILRGIGALLLSLSCWLIWWLMDGVRYFPGA